MFDNIIADLKALPYPSELNNEQWYAYSFDFLQLTNEEKSQFTDILSQHSGIPKQVIIDVFHRLHAQAASSMEHENAFAILQQAQQEATFKITQFRTRRYFAAKRMEHLFISRSQWLTIMHQFEQEHRHHLTHAFFSNALSNASGLQKQDITKLLSKEQPPRAAKQMRGPKAPRLWQSRSALRPSKNDDSINSFIIDEHAPQEIREKIQETGARSCSLTPATPDKRNNILVRTPGGQKARQLCTINGITLFGPDTPPKSSVSKKKDRSLLRFERAKPITFIATLVRIKERYGVCRENSRSKMGISASDACRAEGIKISQDERHEWHWYHLIPHFMGDTSDAITPHQEAGAIIINLVPATAAANYNTLEAIERAIQDKLVRKITSAIKIEIKPRYSGKCKIPDMLTYTLMWEEKASSEKIHEKTEVFYVKPRSKQRLTRGMHRSIEVLRKLSFDECDAEITAPLITTVHL